MPGFAAVLAHQGGWDEALMVLVPLGLFVALLRVANARADRQQDLEQPSGPDRAAHRHPDRHGDG